MNQQPLLVLHSCSIQGGSARPPLAALLLSWLRWVENSRLEKMIKGDVAAKDCASNMKQACYRTCRRRCRTRRRHRSLPGRNSSRVSLSTLCGPLVAHENKSLPFFLIISKICPPHQPITSSHSRCISGLRYQRLSGLVV